MKRLQVSEMSEDFPLCLVLLQIHLLSIFLVDTINDTEDFSGHKLKLKSEVIPVAQEDSLLITQSSNSQIHQLLAFLTCQPLL